MADEQKPQDQEDIPGNVHQEEHRDEPLILEQLEEAKERTKHTGDPSTVNVDKKKFIEEVPHAGQEPRMAFTPDRFKFTYTRFECLTVGELRELCLKAKSHPFAIKKAMEVEGFGDKVNCHLLHRDVRFLRQLANQ